MRWREIREAYVDAEPPAVLYHGTSLINLVAIVSGDWMLLHADDEDTEGAFLTPHRKIAARYSSCMQGGPSGGVISFDVKSLLASGYHIHGNQYWDSDELEFVLTAPDGHPMRDDYELRGILAHVIDIAVSKGCIKRLRDPDLCAPGTEVDMRYDGVSHGRTWEQDVESFLAFPKLRIV